MNRVRAKNQEGEGLRKEKKEESRRRGGVRVKG